MRAMSASGPKRTSLVAVHMSAFGGKADMTVCGNPLSEKTNVNQMQLRTARLLRQADTIPKKLRDF
jgi:hypothetical protein